MLTPMKPFRSLEHIVRQPLMRSSGTVWTTTTIDPTNEVNAAPEQTLVFYTVEEVARTLGVSTKTVRRRIDENIILKAPIGGRLVRISSDELQRLAAGNDAVSVSNKVLGED